MYTSHIIFLLIVLVFALLSAFLLLYSRYIKLKAQLLTESDLKSEPEHLEPVHSSTPSPAAELANQIAHDIRSPLMALQMVTKNLKSLQPEAARTLHAAAERIQDIANNLLSQNRKHKTSQSAQLHCLPAMIEEIVSEKRTELRANMNIRLESERFDSYAVFSRFKPAELRSTIWRIVDCLGTQMNSKMDTLKFKIESNDGFNLIAIISPKLDNLHTVTADLLQIATELDPVDVFTDSDGSVRVTIRMPSEKPPIWYLDNVMVDADTRIVVVDDDVSIHQLWKNRIDQAGQHLVDQMQFFSDPVEFQKWLENNKHDNSIYLIDYEFSGRLQTGLDLIIAANLQKCSVLVTSRFENPTIVNRCTENHIRMLPKIMIDTIPILVSPCLTSANNSVLASTDTSAMVVLLDDDELVQMCWLESAKDNGKHLRVFSTYSSLKDELPSIPRNAEIYIDIDLKLDGLKGDVISKDLYDLGYQNLFIATGYDIAEYSHLSHIRKVIQKDPPWETY